MDHSPPVTLIVLNWNGRALLGDCLRSLLAVDYPDLRVVLVDNASSDDSVSFVRDHFPQVEVIALRENRGFGAGNNAALRQLSTDIAVLVNPDVVVGRDWLRPLIQPLIKDETIGITGSRLVYPSGALQHAGGRVLPPIGRTSQNEDSDTPRDVDYIIGASLAIHRRALAQVGLFDEGYFLYYEDADLCARVQRAGLRVVYVPESHAIHHESALTQKLSPAYLYHFHLGRWRYLLKHLDPATLLHETFPAENKFWSQTDYSWRPHIGRAYRTTLQTLPEILHARKHDGATEMTENEETSLTNNLTTHYTNTQSTSLPPNHHLETMSTAWQLQEHPFTSRFPLIARLRELWNSVATKWYMRPILAQQSAYNQLVVQQAAAQQQHLAHTADWLSQQDHDLVTLTRQMADLRQQLQAAQARIAELESRSAKA